MVRNKKTFKQKETTASAVSKSPQNKESDEENEEYEVEKILDDRIVNEKVEYLIKWKGYPNSDNTWESTDDLNCPNLIKEYQKSKKNKPKRKLNSKKHSNSNKSKTEQSSSDNGDQSDDNDQIDDNVGDLDDSTEYEVKRILDVHISDDGEREFLVQWKGYSKDESTWEPEENLDCEELLQTFLSKTNASGKQTLRKSRKPTDRFQSSGSKKRRVSRNATSGRKTYCEEDD